eukprot:scaffold93375_cov35-Tisochrysis_lutea.AAC.2
MGPGARIWICASCSCSWVYWELSTEKFLLKFPQRSTRSTVRWEMEMIPQFCSQCQVSVSVWQCAMCNVVPRPV